MLLGLLASADLGVLKLSLMGGWSVPRGGMHLREAYVTMWLLALSRVGGGGRELVGCVQSRELDARASPSKIYPAGKLQ